MFITTKYGVEIDNCPQCKGVWLDRGELEKIANMQSRYDDDHYKRYHYGKDHGDDDDDDYYVRQRKNKKKGFISDLFDFD